jgi:hypothetical protein
MEMFTNEIGNFAKKYENRLLEQVDVEANQPMENSEFV